MTKPDIRRLGTIDFGVSETTPVVFGGRPYRFEYINKKYHLSEIPDSYFRFVDVAQGRCTRGFASGYHLGSAHVKGDTAYVYGVPGRWGGREIHVFWSKDLQRWSSRPALRMPGWEIYNNSVCKGPDRYVMVFEIGAPAEVVGVAYTGFFAESDDLIEWRFCGPELAFSKDRYTACPTIRYHRGFYYLFYLERLGPEVDPDKAVFETYVVRTRDFRQWESSPLNPVLAASDHDRRIRNPAISPQQRRRIALAPNINVSDMDLCEYDGQVIMYFSWGSQAGIEYLAEARFDGTLGQLLEAFFP